MQTSLDQNERTWAAVAHVSAVFTLLIGLSTSGIAPLAGVLVPLLIYLSFNDRSRYVAFHALQATVYQASAVLATYVIGLLGGGIIATTWSVTGILIPVIVGFLLLPVAIVLTLIVVLAITLLPLAATIYAVIGSYKTYSGESFEYEYFGEMVRKQIRPVASTGDEIM